MTFVGEERMRRKQTAAGRDDHPEDTPRAASPDSRLPSRLDPTTTTSRHAQSSESAENPPWEQESGRVPIPPQTPPEMRAWQWGSAPDASFAGVDLGDMTGTGKIAAVVPLSPHDSGWSKGLTAPPVAGVALGGAVEVDQQPSAQMRALRVGNLARAAAIVTVAMVLSRVLGVFRTSLFAATFFSANTESRIQADAFTNAFALPDAIFTIVAGGALASAFIPVFADYLIERRDRDTAWHVASSALNLSLAVLTLLAILGFLFTEPFLSLTMHPYFVNNNPEGPIIVELTRIMLLQPIFLGGATVAIAILQARQRFILPAIGQVIYTASLIGGIAATALDQRYGLFGGHLGIAGPAWGVVAGAVLQFLIQVPGLVQAKMHYSFSLDLFHPGVREMIRLMVPRMLNASLLFVSVFINRDLLALLQSAGAVYGYVTAFQLVLLPIGVFGMAISQAAFPTLAALVSAGQWERLRETIMRTVRGVTYLALPSSLGLIVLSDPLSRLLLAHGNFDASKLALISHPLIFFAVGLLGLALVEILTRSFYALHDTRTAVEVSLLQFLFVIGLSIDLLHPLGASGLALATSLGSLGEAWVLLLLLRPRLGGLNLKSYYVFTLNVLAASVVSALAALFVYTLARVVIPDLGTVPLTLRLMASIAAATVVYFGFARFLGIDEVLPLNRILQRLTRRG